MERKKINRLISTLFICGVLTSCNFFFGRTTLKPPCNIDKKLWQDDFCGTNGYRKEIAECLRLKSDTKPVFHDLSSAINSLGNPDTIFYNNDNTKTLFYVIQGTPSCMLLFPSGVLESFTVFISEENKVTAISGGIH